ncbi:auxin efflux carrier component 7-like [Dorcoceras hygrometricum]|uniref:Auxin efflux carrier component 7-like n=1 Tax=Dorcoceras hygrometricum TaxID=472368 RepID=A0A2Z7CAL2_9LAMI|nr:auxin efflux carrier component 7-like [Dorcoceras hygrometricum]
MFIYIFAQHLIDLRFATTDQQFASAIVSSSNNSFQKLIVFFVITLRSTAVHSAVGFLRIGHQLFVQISTVHQISLQLYLQISSAYCSHLLISSTTLRHSFSHQNSNVHETSRQTSLLNQ